MGLEYRYVSLYLQGKLTYEEMFRTLNIRIHQFAKRQDTWFRGMERRGITIHWLEKGDYGLLRELVKKIPLYPPLRKGEGLLPPL